ncbi:MAG TPA: DUF6346 domain-containing protein [Actinoplanes sp.]|nr:DUF6346 domain-containing protein [Actinoplanes sp.]
MTKAAESAAEDPLSRALADYERRGPIGYRLVSLSKAVALLVSVPLLWLLLATLTGFYHGTGTPWAGREVPATAQVGECECVGPVSASGFGNWWECQIKVELVGLGAIFLLDAVVGPHLYFAIVDRRSRRRSTAP